MIDFLLTLNWSQIIVALIVTSGGAMAVWYRAKMRSWHTAWKRVFEGLQDIPALRTEVKGIAYFVSPNGGGSLMDSVKRMEATITTIADRVEMLAETAIAENDIDEAIARFHCAPTGENIYVNQTYARWLGVGKSELLGWNFLNLVHADDAPRVQAHWTQCRAEHRQYRQTHRMIASSGEVITLAVTLSPIPEVGEARRWIGYARKVPVDHVTDSK